MVKAYVDLQKKLDELECSLAELCSTENNNVDHAVVAINDIEARIAFLKNLVSADKLYCNGTSENVELLVYRLAFLEHAFLSWEKKIPNIRLYYSNGVLEPDDDVDKVHVCLNGNFSESEVFIRNNKETVFAPEHDELVSLITLQENDNDNKETVFAPEHDVVNLITSQENNGNNDSQESNHNDDDKDKDMIGQKQWFEDAGENSVFAESSTSLCNNDGKERQQRRQFCIWPYRFMIPVLAVAISVIAMNINANRVEEEFILVQM